MLTLALIPLVPETIEVVLGVVTGWWASGKIRGKRR